MAKKNEQPNEEEMPTLSLDELKEMEVGQSVDLSEFDKKTAKLAGATTQWVDSVYNKYGEELPNGKTEKVLKLKIFSEPVTTFEAKDGRKIEIRASELFGLRYEDEKGWGISDSDKSKLNKFLKDLKLPPGKPGVSKIGGQDVVLKLIEGGNGNHFLGFRY